MHLIPDEIDAASRGIAGDIAPEYVKQGADVGASNLTYDAHYVHTRLRASLAYSHGDHAVIRTSTHVVTARLPHEYSRGNHVETMRRMIT